jgi:hypothetical protein
MVKVVTACRRRQILVDFEDSWPKKLCTTAIQNITSTELLTKQAMSKQFYYIQKIHTFLSYFSM